MPNHMFRMILDPFLCQLICIPLVALHSIVITLTHNSHTPTQITFTPFQRYIQFSIDGSSACSYRTPPSFSATALTSTLLPHHSNQTGRPLTFRRHDSDNAILLPSITQFRKVPEWLLKFLECREQRRNGLEFLHIDPTPTGNSAFLLA